MNRRLDGRHSGGGRRTLAAAVVAALIGGLVGTTSVASANWEPAQRVDNAGTGFGATYVQNAAAVGPNGLATALFFQQAPSTPPGAPAGSPFMVRRAAGAGTAWSGPGEITTPAGQVAGAANPGLAARADGGTLGVFAFQPLGGGNETLALDWPAADAAPGAAIPVLCTSGATPECAASTPGVAVDGSGNGYAVASTSLFSGDVLFARGDASTGAWGPAEVVAKGVDPLVAVDSGGDIVITYARLDPDAPSALIGQFYRLYGKRQLASEQSFGSEHLLSGPDEDHTVDNIAQAQTALVIDGAGTATAAFPRGTAPATGGPPNAPATFAVRWPRGAEPQAAQQLSRQMHGNATHPVLAVDPQGRVTAAWDETSPGSAVYVAQYTSGSSFGATQQVSPANGPGSYSGPQVAADAAGTATLVYYDQANPTAGLALDAQRKPAGQPWSAPVAISASGAGAGGVGGSSIHVVAAKAGQADATFVQSLSGTNQLFATRWVDTTAPTITIAVPTDGATYLQGTTVQAGYTCADEPGGSGLASCSGPVPSGQPIDTSSPGSHAFTVTAEDNAGNVATKTVTYTVQGGAPPPDTTPPTIVLTVPADGASYRQGRTVKARYSCADEPGGSGLASCSGPVPSGRRINTRSPGTHTFSVIAQDNDGNVGSKTATYTVRSGPPQTKIKSRPKRRTRRRNATFKFVSSQPRSSFECKLDHGGFKRCRSPKTYRHLRPGRHTFHVRATNPAGETDRTPAKRRWTIKK